MQSAMTYSQMRPHEACESRRPVHSRASLGFTLTYTVSLPTCKHEQCQHCQLSSKCIPSETFIQAKPYLGMQFALDQALDIRPIELEAVTMLFRRCS